ncbi:MAG: branched-chain amino acid transaminase, partial [Myxococcota bacterium]
ASPLRTSKSIMVDKVEWIWEDGEWVRWDDSKIHILTHTLHYGLGVFEGIRCYAQAGGGGAVFRLKEHIDRLFESANMCLMHIPFTREQVSDACLEIVSRNGLTGGCYLRPIAYLGAGQMGLAADNDVKITIASWAWGAYLGEDGIKNGIRTKVSSFRRPKADSSLPKGKICGQYVMSILAKRDALADGYAEAIMLDTEGRVCEGTGENIFVVKNGRVATPPLGQALLGGITRSTVIELLEGRGLTVHEETISREQLYTADEIFLTGTAAEVTPVREIDRRTVGPGHPGELTKWVQTEYAAMVRGEREKYVSYCEKVPEAANRATA